MTEPRLISLDGSHALSAWRNVLILIWREGIEDHAAEDFYAATRQMRQRYPDGAGTFHVVERTSGVPSGVVRGRLVDSANTVKDIPSFVAVVAEGQDLRSSLVRGVTTSMSMVIGRQLSMRVFATVPLAADFVAAQLSMMKAAGTAEEVAAAVEITRAAIG